MNTGDTHISISHLEMLFLASLYLAFFFTNVKSPCCLCMSAFVLFCLQMPAENKSLKTSTAAG